jgi:hypothetical protein
LWRKPDEPQELQCSRFACLRLIEALLMMDPPQGIMGLRAKALRSVDFQQDGGGIGLHDELGQTEERMAE